MVKPGYDARASSTSGAVNALPAVSGDGSRTVTRSRALAASSVGGVLVVGAGEGPVDGRRTGAGGRPGGLDLAADPVGLGVDVEAGEDELHLVAEAAEVVEADLGVSAAGPSRGRR